MERYLIDTNSVSAYLSASLTKKGIEFMDAIIDAGPNISIITEIELLCWNTPDKTTAIKVRNFINDCTIYEITPNVVLQCVKIRKGRKIKTPDAIIAATALANEYTILTDNEKDFKNIEGLKIINPAKL